MPGEHPQRKQKQSGNLISRFLRGESKSSKDSNGESTNSKDPAKSKHLRFEATTKLRKAPPGQRKQKPPPASLASIHGSPKTKNDLTGSDHHSPVASTGSVQSPLSRSERPHRESIDSTQTKGSRNHANSVRSIRSNTSSAQASEKSDISPRSHSPAPRLQFEIPPHKGSRNAGRLGSLAKSSRSSAHSSSHSLQDPPASPVSTANTTRTHKTRTPTGRNSIDSLESQISLDHYQPNNELVGFATRNTTAERKYGSHNAVATGSARRRERLDRLIRKAEDKYGDPTMKKIKAYSRKVEEYGVPITLDAMIALFRGARIWPPVGIIIACAAGVVHHVVESLHEVRINGELADCYLEECIDEVETCWNTVFRAARTKEGEVSQDVLSAIEIDMTRVIEHCQKVHHKIIQYKNKRFIERFIKREDIKKDLRVLGSSISFETNNLRFFVLVRSLTILLEVRAENERDHKQLLDGIYEIQRSVRSVERKIDRLSTDNFRKDIEYRDSGTQLAPEFWDLYLASAQKKKNHEETLESTVQFAEQLDENDFNELSTILAERAREREKAQKMQDQMDRLKYEMHEIKDKEYRIQEVKGKDASRLLYVLEIEENDIPEAIASLKRVEKEIQAKIKRKEAHVYSTPSDSEKQKLRALEIANMKLRIRFADEAVRELQAVQKGKRPDRNSNASGDLPKVKSGEQLADLLMQHHQDEVRNHSRDNSRPSTPRGSVSNSRTAEINPHIRSGTCQSKLSSVQMAPEDDSRSARRKTGSKPQMKSTGVQVDATELAGRRHLQPVLLKGEARIFSENLIHNYSTGLRQYLWTPSERCSVGDVGYIATDGSFTCLFNAFNVPRWLRGKVPSLKKIPEEEKKYKVAGREQLKSRMAVMREERTAGEDKDLNTRIKRRVKMNNHTRSEVAFMYLEGTRYRYLRNLNEPKQWFKKHVHGILRAYSNDHVNLHKKNIILVTGKLDARDYAFLINRSAPVEQIHFYVKAKREEGEKWGFFARDLERQAERKKDKVIHRVARLSESESSEQISDVPSNGEFCTVMLERLRLEIKKGANGEEILEPTSH